MALQNFISQEHLNELFAKLRFSPNSKAFNKVKEIINNDLQADSNYPDDCAEEIIEFLELDIDYKEDIIEVLKPIYIRDENEFDFFPDNH